MFISKRENHMTFDPRTIGASVYDVLKGLRGNLSKEDKTAKQQKSQAVELYTYLSTWGMMRLKAEENALGKEMEGKKQVVRKFFLCLEELSQRQNLANDQGLVTLKNLDVSDYLGLTGLGLAIAREFSFWATAVYHDVSGED
jgi:hypothetical protein